VDIDGFDDIIDSNMYDNFGESNNNFLFDSLDVEGPTTSKQSSDGKFPLITPFLEYFHLCYCLFGTSYCSSILTVSFVFAVEFSFSF
jgi:hypothetical protein